MLDSGFQLILDYSWSSNGMNHRGQENILAQDSFPVIFDDAEEKSTMRHVSSGWWKMQRVVGQPNAVQINVEWRSYSLPQSGWPVILGRPHAPGDDVQLIHAGQTQFELEDCQPATLWFARHVNTENITWGNITPISSGPVKVWILEPNENWTWSVTSTRDELNYVYWQLHAEDPLTGAAFSAPLERAPTFTPDSSCSVNPEGPGTKTVIGEMSDFPIIAMGAFLGIAAALFLAIRRKKDKTKYNHADVPDPWVEQPTLESIPYIRPEK
jgi:hypothetical protein